MSRITKKVHESVQEYISTHHPTEELKASLMGMEGVSFFAEVALLGPIASAAGRNQYHIGLTNKRITLIPLSFWSGKPSGRVTEIHLARVNNVEFKKRMLSSRLDIYYGQDMKHLIMLPWTFKKSGEEFINAFSLIPTPTITEEEMKLTLHHESFYEQDKKDMKNNAILAFVLVVLFLIIINVLSM